jgi:hypothetical protein
MPYVYNNGTFVRAAPFGNINVTAALGEALFASYNHALEAYSGTRTSFISQMQ